MSQRFIWGHINVNVADLDLSITFYEKLGFELFRPSIPYLGLEAKEARAMPEAIAQALAVPLSTKGRACIMQLGKGLPKLDLTEFSNSDIRPPLRNQDHGIVRLCLATKDLHAAYLQLTADGVEFLAPPTQCSERMAEVAVCKDPDGTLIELLQVHLERWPRISRPAT
jgi:catechol 2,3-dioxygenase-like lactoylglutathione lyase family enzyme